MHEFYLYIRFNTHQSIQFVAFNGENMKIIHYHSLWLATFLLLPFLLTSCTPDEPPPSTERPPVGMIIVPTIGKAGQIFEVHGSGFPVGSSLHIFLGPQDHSSSFHELGDIFPNETGTFVFSFEMPSSWPKNGDIILTRDLLLLATNDDGGIQAEAPFLYDFESFRAPSFIAQPDNGGPGAQVVLSGKDFPLDTLFYVLIGRRGGDLDTTALTQVQVDDQGLFTIKITMPEKWGDSDQLISEKELMIVLVDSSNISILASTPFDFQPTKNPNPDDDNGDDPDSVCDDNLLLRNDFLGYVQVQQLNVRSGPGIVFQLITTIPQCDLITLLARNEEASWLNVQLVNETTGWVYGQYVKTNMDILDLPVKEGPDEPPNGSGNNNGSKRGVLVTIEGLQAEVVAWGMPANDEFIVWLSGDEPALGLQVGNGKSDAEGNVNIIFIMPSHWSDGQPVTETTMYLSLRTQTGTSVTATITYIRWLEEDDGMRNRID
jgi:uncharacterized protein YgiM (DUF1202 family)